MRSAFLPEPSRTTERELLQQYSKVRLQWGEATDHIEKVRMLRNDGLRLQDHIWNVAVENGLKNPTPLNALLLQSLNDAIDLEGLRWAAYQSHIASSVVYLNVVVALFAATLIGYAFGLDRVRHLFSMCLLDVTITAALGRIVDLDRPRCGFITVSQQPMSDLVKALPDAIATAPDRSGTYSAVPGATQSN